MTPSSAATTSTTMSVTLAPRARMRVKASWPGVSMKTILRPFMLHVIRADVLRDAAGLAARHVGFANGVEQRGLAVIDVAHDGHHRGALQQVLRVLGVFHFLHGFLFVADGGGGGAELARQFGGQFRIERLVDGGEDSLVHQLLDHQARLDVELFGKLLDRDAFGDGDLAVDGRRARLHWRRVRPQYPLFFHDAARLRARRAVCRRRPRPGSTGGGASPGSIRAASGMLGRGPLRDGLGRSAGGGRDGHQRRPGRIGPR